MRLLQIGSLAFPNANTGDSLPVTARSALLQLKNGAFDQDGSQVVVQAGRISRRAWLVGQDLDGQRDSLMLQLLKGRQVLIAQLRDNVRQRATYGKVTAVGHTVEVDTYEFQQALSFDFDQDFPFWWDADQVDFFDTGLFFDSGISFDGHFTTVTLTTSPYTFSITNGGSARGIWGAVCVMPEAASSIADLRLTNLTNGLSLRYTGTVTAAQRLDIDFLNHTVTVASSDAYANFAIDDPAQIEWMALETGGNNFQVTATIVGTVKLYYQWGDLFV